MFIVYLEAESGCDYSIGCGTELFQLEAETLEAAIQETKEFILSDYDFGEIENATIFNVIGKLEIPLNYWYEQIKNKVTAEQLQEQEIKERKLLEKLTLKYKGK